MASRYEIRPLGQWIGPVTPDRKSSAVFRAKWADTLDLLGYETEQLGARLVVVQIDVTAGDLRRDGMLRANARANFPGVRVSFDSHHGPLTYATDEYESRYSGDPPSWQTNVRAVALALQALRAVDQFGVGRGTQYDGFMPSAARLDKTPAGAFAIPLRDHKRRITSYALVDAEDRFLADRSWYRLASGYVVRTEHHDGRKVMIYLHREVSGLGTFDEDPIQVDHINGNRLDNHSNNLQAANHSQNGQNRGANRGRSLPRGVHFRARTGEYLALAKLHGKRYEIGSFPAPEAADRAVRAWRAANMPFSADARRAAILRSNRGRDLLAANSKPEGD